VDTQQLRVDLTADETDIASIAVGQAASITFDALPGHPLSGAVVAINPVPTTSNGVVTYSVRVSLDPAAAEAAGVRVGMTASASIVTASRQGVVVVASRAIKTQGGARTVQVLAGEGETETRQVQTGLTGGTLTEIVSGLQAGDKVVVSGATSGTAVAPSTGATALVAPGIGGAGGVAAVRPAGAP
jgi:macrolide-specific efflux system membrane fusion protein